MPLPAALLLATLLVASCLTSAAAPVHADAGAATIPVSIAGIRLTEATRIATFFEERGEAPVWLDDPEVPLTADALPAQLRALQRALAQGRDHGLDPDSYPLETLDRLIDKQDRGNSLARSEIEQLATEIFLRHAHHRAEGRIDPAGVDPEWHLRPAETDPDRLLEALGRGVPADFLLDSLWPEDPAYWALVDERQRLLARQGHPPNLVSAGGLLRIGSEGARVLELRARLKVEPLDHATFDAPLEQSVREFQQDQGLGIDGIVGPNTLDALNLTDAERISRIEVNLERWRWLPRSLPGTRVVVNVAEYQLRAYQDGAEAFAMNVIVGTPFRRTPVFSEAMRYLVFNPYWNVPRRIAVLDKLPLLKRDADSLAASGYEARPAVEGAAHEPVSAFDWQSVTPRGFNYLLRQRPGPNNALGRVKFVLPNAYSVYLHDTPTRELFARTGRAFSSGCIRLEQAMDLARWVLRDQPAWTPERIEAALANSKPIEVPLTRPVPVMIVYLTVVVGNSGAIYFRPDLYGRDRAIALALGASG